MDQKINIQIKDKVIDHELNNKDIPKHFYVESNKMIIQTLLYFTNLPFSVQRRDKPLQSTSKQSSAEIFQIEKEIRKISDKSMAEKTSAD